MVAFQGSWYIWQFSEIEPGGVSYVQSTIPILCSPLSYSLRQQCILQRQSLWLETARSCDLQFYVEGTEQMLWCTPGRPLSGNLDYLGLQEPMTYPLALLCSPYLPACSPDTAARVGGCPEFQCLKSITDELGYQNIDTIDV